METYIYMTLDVPSTNAGRTEQQVPFISGITLLIANLREARKDETCLVPASV